MIYRIFVANGTDFCAEFGRIFPGRDYGVQPDGRYYDVRTRGDYDAHVVGGLRPLEVSRLERYDVERRATAEDLETVYHLVERLLVEVDPDGEAINWAQIV